MSASTAKSVIPSTGPGAWTPSSSVESVENDTTLRYVSQYSQMVHILIPDPYPLDGVPRPKTYPLARIRPVVRTTFNTSLRPPPSTSLSQTQSQSHVQPDSPFVSPKAAPFATPIYAARKRKRAERVTYAPSEHGSSDFESFNEDLTHLVEPVEPVSPVVEHRQSGSTFAMRQFTNKGQGLLAARDIQRGEEIIREAPFITFQQPIDQQTLHRTFRAMPQELQETFLAFTSTVPDVDDELVGIAETNAIDIYNPEDNEKTLARKYHSNIGRSGIFKNICRVNHSCCPNAGWSWSHSMHQLRLIAHVAIPTGSEILVSYKGEEGAHPRKHRRQVLLRDFGFHCACLPCSLPNAAESDARLREYQTIRQDWNENPQDFSTNRGAALLKIQRCIDILEEEGKLSLLDEALEVRFAVYAMWGMKEKAKACAQAAYEGFALRNGRERARVQDCAVWRSRPETYWGWAKCLKAEMAMKAAKKMYDDDSDSGFEDRPGKRKKKSGKKDYRARR